MAGEKSGKQAKQPRAAAVAGPEKGTLLVRWPSDKPWRVEAPRGTLFAGEPVLALPGFVAALGSGKPDSALKVELIGNLPGLYRAAFLETLGTLHEPKDVDVDLTLDRGRVVLSHAGKKGHVKCRIRHAKEQWTVELSEPGTAVVATVRLHRRAWTDFPKKPDPKIRPSAEMNLIVLAGSADLSEASGRQTLGPKSRYYWNSETGSENATVLDKLPDDLKPANDAEAKKLLTAVRDLQTRLATGAPATVLKAAAQDKDAQIRTASVFGLAAVGEIGAVLSALADAKRAEVRLAALIALRHWVGQSYDDDQRVYELLLLQKYSKSHAEIVVKLLHNFTPTQLAQPESYEALIHYLTHERLAIRQLAAWHLNRLVPDGEKIAYNPAGSPEELRRGQAAWRKRIPEGKIPTAPPG
jgi:hypothetical protein